MQQDDLKRIERKLDMIIQHFNIGSVPRRSNIELDKIVREKILQFKTAESKKKNGCAKNKRK